MRKTKVKRAQGRIDKHQLKANLKSNKARAISTLNEIKCKTLTVNLFDTFREVITRENIDNLNKDLFPKKISEIINIEGMLHSSSVANEIIWSISTLILYKDEIRVFVSKTKHLESMVINNDKTLFFNTLKDIEDTFGWSHWLIENRIAATQHWYGSEIKREMVRDLKDVTTENLLTNLLIHFIGKRVEDASIPGYLQSELSKVFKTQDSRVIHDYAKIKIFDSNHLNFEQIPLLLNFEFKSNLIDLYETIISVLRWISADARYLDALGKVLGKPTSVLYKVTKDVRLLPILIAFGIDLDFDYDCHREKIIESYTSGNNEEVLSLIKKYFEVIENRTDIAILMIGLKTESKIDKKIDYPEALSTIASHIREVLKYDDNSYAAALALNSFNDKFMNQTWTTYVRFAVMNELTVQDFSSELDYLRDLYTRDSRISPFSFLLSTDKSYIIKQLRKLPDGLFTLTKIVLEVATTGITRQVDVVQNISRDRYLKYLGRYYLSSKNHDLAIKTFEEAVKKSIRYDDLKNNSALITAKLRKGEVESSIEGLIDTYLKWSSVPTALPFEEIIAALDDPEVWPSTIILPLALALYTNFYKNDKIAHLRYSFELYNINNNIKNPQDLLNPDLGLNIEHIKLYLKLVWRPEIMGQTLIYNGSKEIEEARIQVCKVLVEIDVSNASDYQSEIRERIKNLELAKVTKLVDQSRVYVDVTAIKKSLKSRLSDVYAKYKNTMLAVEEENKEITDTIEAIAGAIQEIDNTNSSLTRMMSSLHLFGGEDMQFAALFSEIVDEFLLGEHGLNAYLSTRVRHGKFSNAIRKPIADEYLITEMSEETNKYSSNVFWSQKLTELNETERQNVLALLEAFGKKIDQIISFVRDDLIQVSIQKDLSYKTPVNNALFIYRTSSFERMYARSKIKISDNIDEFIDLCIDILWQKTDDNLVIVKNKILGDIKQEILLAFDYLSEKLGQLGYSDRLGELHNHIARAKTNIQHQISNVASWFTRNEVYDRPDYTPDFPILIAKSMVSNSISGANNWNGIKISQDKNINQMPGRTLDGMVDLYCALFENAIEHSGLPIQDLNINVAIDYRKNNYKVVITNNINKSQVSTENSERITSIREDIRKKDTRIKAQKEKGSGFHKMWSTINAPHYKEPALTFSYLLPDTFEVNIKFIVESIYEKNINN